MTTDRSILYAPCHVTSPHDACELPDLLASTRQNKFYTPFDVTLTSRTRTSKSSNTFFCPVCPTQPIVITKSPFTIRCPSCKWNAAEHGVTTVADLLLADSRPHHELFKLIKRLGEGLLERDPIAVLEGVHDLDSAQKEGDVNEIPRERRFDNSVRKKEQEPARRRFPKPKVRIEADGEVLGSVEESIWKVEHKGEKILPRLRVLDNAETSLHVRNERDREMRMKVGKNELTLRTEEENVIKVSPESVSGWQMLDLTVSYTSGVYRGDWTARLFFK